MGVYDNLPVFNLDLLPLSRMNVRVVDDGFEGGRNGNNEPQAISLSGGGRLNLDFEVALAHTRDQHRLINMLEARLSGSFRYVNVPILTDWMGPFQTLNGIPQPYGVLFDPDESLIDTPTGGTPSVVGTISEDAALHAGTIKMTLSPGAETVRYSMWFSIQHPTKGHRAYRVWLIMSGAPNYQFAISPPLREAVPYGTLVRISRPLCVMRYPSGFTAGWDVRKFWISQPTFQFVEAP